MHLSKKLLGVDIGGTKCAVVLGEENATILEKIKFPTESPEKTIRKILEAVDALTEKYGSPDAIGICCGGPLDEARGVILSPPNLPGWDEVPIVSILSEHSGVPTKLCNDANACALAEHWCGAGRGANNVIFLTFGTGLGAGLILDGKLYEGSCGAAGEIGHIRLAADGPIGFGKSGSFEGFCSGGGIARLAHAYGAKVLAEKGSVFGVCDTAALLRLDTAALAALAHAGDADARRIFEQSAERLGEGLAILVDAFNPDVIVIGNVYTRATDLFEPHLVRVLQRECLPQNLACCRVVPSPLGERIGDLSAIAVALRASATGAQPPDAHPIEWSHLDGLCAERAELRPLMPAMRRAVEAIVQAHRSGGKVLLAGNGGSAADCEHIAGELIKGFLLRRKPTQDALGGIPTEIAEDLQSGLCAIPIPSLSAANSAFANDVSAENVYAQAVFAMGRKGDVFIGISTSGNARNVLNAAKTAKGMGMRTIALTGAAGGQLAATCDIALCAPASETYRVQELHLPIYHALCAQVEQILFGTK